MGKSVSRAGGRVEVVASLSQGRTAAAQCGLFTYKSVPVIFEPPCIPIPVAAGFKAWVCGPSLAGIMGSNPAGDMDVCLL